MHEFTTPMMKQYALIKKEYKDCLLFFRMGDFYELFMEDAHIGARVLDITLTSRPKGKDGRIPMAGVPYHAVDSYLSKLVKAGYKVAICEQVSLPNKYGIVDREVVRVVTPGTVLDEKALQKNENNYIVSVYIENETLAIATADISTGYFGVYEVRTDTIEQALRNEISRLAPSECILPEHLYNDTEILKILNAQSGINIYTFAEWDSYADHAYQFLKKHFGTATLSGFGLDKNSLCLRPASALLGYLKLTQKAPVNHIKKISKIGTEDYMVLDRSTIINLELFSTIREHDPKGSLLSILDNTKTSMGARLLKSWIKQPLNKKSAIERRHEGVEELYNNESFSTGTQNLLSRIPDIERAISRLSVGVGNARDLINLKEALVTVLAIRESLVSAESSILKNMYSRISSTLSDVVSIIETNIVEEPPLEVKEGGLIKNGVSNKIDRLRRTVSGSRNWILDLEAKEREKTGITSLKIRFNKVFGFYIEISKANLHLVPDYFTRKQTLVNGERFITADLKHHEEIVLTAEEKIKLLEYELYQQILAKVLAYTDLMQESAHSISELDCLTSFAVLAQSNDYVRPKLLYSGEMRIAKGRHPVVEKLLDERPFVPNDVTLNTIDQQLLLITGPNMAGKSVFIRQVALIVLMAQIGCFVPAEKAHISVVDRIFVRSGASDVITSGLSTFMVEMVETAHILHNATKNSLIIMDEIGRGTSTYDGISIAWAVAEYLVTHYKSPPKVLFATHYHELQALEEQYPKKIRNFHMAVADDKGAPVFLHTILPGGASHSFGIAVARLAGVPEHVIGKAQEILKDLENRNGEKGIPVHDLITHEYHPSSIHLIDRLIHKELEEIEIARLTPLEALNKLAELKEKVTTENKTQKLNSLD